jgi:hypothetical protein
MGNTVSIHVLQNIKDNPTRAIGTFDFMNSIFIKNTGLSVPFSMTSTFHYTNNATELHSLQVLPTKNDPEYVTSPPYVSYASGLHGSEVRFFGINPSWDESFSHNFVHFLLGTLSSAEDLNDLFEYYDKTLPVSFVGESFGAEARGTYNELATPYAVYNWELTFHVPMALATQFRLSKQYDKALQVLQYIFNPFAKGDDIDPYWKFRPFQEIVALDYLEEFFNSLGPGKANQEITEWRKNPFSPHVIARSRPVAYMKWVVVSYIQTCVEFGDYYFRQNTLESIPRAMQMYILASHIYGPRGQKIPKRGKVESQTFQSLVDKWDAFENAVVNLEVAFPFSNQISTPLPQGFKFKETELPNIFGFATTRYFCIPDNPQLRVLGATIDDRLFKLRHCQDINGVVRRLALWEPPLDIGLLVQAAAKGISIDSVLNDLNSPMPNYRFVFLLQKALEMVGELKSLGAGFLTIKEKRDSEALSVLRAHHDTAMQELVMIIKTKQLDDAQKTIDSLRQNRKSPAYRLKHFYKLAGIDLPVPDEGDEFKEIDDAIETPVADGTLRLSPGEKEEMDKFEASAALQATSSQLELLSNIFHALPITGGYAVPLGCGIELAWGFPNLANASSAMARAIRNDADELTFQSTKAGKKSNFLRQLQDRVHQANNAGLELMQIDKQLVSQQIKIDIAAQEIANHQTMIDSTREVEEFLKSKYTNEELYIWMEGEVRTRYYQSYTLAYALAKRAETAYYFERPLESTGKFIEFGYWDPSHDGLYCGERLFQSLKQLEAAYQEQRGHDFEVSKQVSLRQINPFALVQLRESASCEFALPEVLFDMDFPGQYNRRIKTVALTIPCVVGPYTGVTCTLRLTSHKYRISPLIAKGKGDYPEKTDEDDVRFATGRVPISAIATSSSQNDGGVFELLFRDERYMPFEGAGVITTWKLELPDSFRQFDYNTITDVILNIHYTSVDGGDNLKAVANDSLLQYVNDVQNLSEHQGLFTFFDLRNEFANEWYQAMHPAAGSTERKLTLNNLNNLMPIFTKVFTNVTATDILIFTSTGLAPGDLSLSSISTGPGGGTDGVGFHGGTAIRSMKQYIAEGQTLPIGTWVLTISNFTSTTVLENMWMVVRYTLSK